MDDAHCRSMQGEPSLCSGTASGTLEGLCACLHSPRSPEGRRFDAVVRLVRAFAPMVFANTYGKLEQRDDSLGRRLLRAFQVQPLYSLLAWTSRDARGDAPLGAGRWDPTRGDGGAAQVAGSRTEGQVTAGGPPQEEAHF